MDLDTSHLRYHNLKTKYDLNKHPKLLFDNATKGKSIEAFCNAAGITRKTCYEWVNQYPEFEQVFEAAESIAYEWWCALGLQNCDNEFWDNTVWKHTMNTRFRSFTNGVNLKGFDKLKCPKERYEYIVNAVATSKIISKESKAYTDLIEAGQKIESNADLLSRVEALEKARVS